MDRRTRLAGSIIAAQPSRGREQAELIRKRLLHRIIEASQ
jgi:hypothetical protein